MVVLVLWFCAVVSIALGFFGLYVVMRELWEEDEFDAWWEQHKWWEG